MADKVNDKNLGEVAGGKHNKPLPDNGQQETFSFNEGERIYCDPQKLSSYVVKKDAINVNYLYDVICDAYNRNSIIAYDTPIKATVLAAFKKDYN